MLLFDRHPPGIAPAIRSPPRECRPAGRPRFARRPRHHLDRRHTLGTRRPVDAVFDLLPLWAERHVLEAQHDEHDDHCHCEPGSTPGQPSCFHWAARRNSSVPGEVSADVDIEREFVIDQAASATIAVDERSKAFRTTDALIIFNPLRNNVLLEESVVQTGRDNPMDRMSHSI